MHTYSILVDSASMGCQILWPFSSSLPTHCRNSGRSENLEGRVLMWGHDLPSLFEIVLTKAVADGFWVAELQVRQVKISSKSCFHCYVD